MAQPDYIIVDDPIELPAVNKEKVKQFHDRITSKVLPGKEKKADIFPYHHEDACNNEAKGSTN